MMGGNGSPLDLLEKRVQQLNNALEEHLNSKDRLINEISVLKNTAAFLLATNRTLLEMGGWSQIEIVNNVKKWPTYQNLEVFGFTLNDGVIEHSIQPTLFTGNFGMGEAVPNPSFPPGYIPIAYRVIPDSDS